MVQFARQEEVMGQLGIWEIIVIFMVALLVFGPKKLPELGKSLGKGLREFRKATDELKSNWNDQMRDVENATRDDETATEETSKDIKTEEATKDIKKVERDMKAEFYKPYQPADSEAPKEEASSNARQN